MEVLIQRDSLLTACQIANAAVSPKALRTVLSSFKVTAIDSSLIIEATDQEIGIEYRVPNVIVNSPGSTAIPAAKLIAIVRELPEGEFTLSSDDRSCEIQANRTEFKIQTEDVATFPGMPASKDGDEQIVASADLRAMIRQTLFATSKKDAQYCTSGVLWEFDDGKISLVATDTFRLALASSPAKTSQFNNGVSHVVPEKAMILLDRSLTTDEDVAVSFTGNSVFYRTERATISSRLLEGVYPAYKKILPKGDSIKISVSVEKLLPAVRQATIMADAEIESAALTFGGNKLIMKSVGFGAGQSVIELPIEYVGEPMTVHLAPKHIGEFLKVLDTSSSVEINLVSPNKPVIFRYGEGQIHVIMPKGGK